MQEEIITKLQESVETELVIGEPVEAGGISFLPLLKVVVGGGIKDEATGGGGAVLQPEAVIVINKQEVSYFSLVDDADEGEIKQKLPEVIEKIELVD